MKKHEMVALLRSAGVDENAVTLAINAWEMGAEDEREECLKIAESKRHAPNFQLTSMPPQNGTAVDIANLIKDRFKL
jgi:hypothetical protein